jgi:hypothetical protein
MNASQMRPGRVYDLRYRSHLGREREDRVRPTRFFVSEAAWHGQPDGPKAMVEAERLERDDRIAPMGPTTRLNILVGAIESCEEVAE